MQAMGDAPQGSFLEQKGKNSPVDKKETHALVPLEMLQG